MQLNITLQLLLLLLMVGCRDQATSKPQFVPFSDSAYKEGSEIQSPATRGDVVKIKAALKKNPELAKHSRKADKWTPLHGAANNGHFEAVKILVQAGADVNAQNINKRTALHGAAQKGALAIVKFLVENGADLNIIGFQGRTPLDFATEANKTDIVNYLKGKGAKRAKEKSN